MANEMPERFYLKRNPLSRILGFSANDGTEYIRADIAKAREIAAKIEGHQAGMQTAAAICVEFSKSFEGQAVGRLSVAAGLDCAEAILAELEAANPRPNKAVPLVPDDQRPQGIPW